MNIKSKKKKIFGFGTFSKKPHSVKPLSNFDIINIMDNRDGESKSNFIGVFSKDVLPIKINTNESLILNLDNDNGSGTHWTCIYNADDSEFVEYFDSYGLPPPLQAVKYMKTSNKQIAYSNSQIQSVNSVLCGYYVMYYINERDNRSSMYDIIYRFDHIIGNGLTDKKSPKILLDYFNLG